MINAYRSVFALKFASYSSRRRLRGQFLHISFTACEYSSQKFIRRESLYIFLTEIFSLPSSIHFQQILYISFMNNAPLSANMQLLLRNLLDGSYDQKSPGQLHPGLLPLYISPFGFF